jgi:hypothetical protein
VRRNFGIVTLCNTFMYILKRQQPHESRQQRSEDPMHNSIFHISLLVLKALLVNWSHFGSSRLIAYSSLASTERPDKRNGLSSIRAVTCGDLGTFRFPM